MLRQLNPSILFTSPELTKQRLKNSSRVLTPWPLIPFLILCLFIVAAFDIHAEAYLNAIGGLGGSQYKTPCPQGQNLTGFELRAGDDVEAIRPVCVISYGPTNISAPPLTSAWSGGPSGKFEQLLCPPKTPIVIGIDVGAEGVDTIVVNSIYLYCGLAVNSPQTPEKNPSTFFEAPLYKAATSVLGSGSDARYQTGSQPCPTGQVAVGVHGRSGVWLDSMGLICDAPRLTAEPQYKSLGRVKTSSATNYTTPQSICDSARSARARNSPAAPALEAQCKASGEIQYKSLGRVKTSPTTNLPPRTICESAKSARARNSPAAPALEAQCKAQEVKELQTKMLETEPVEVQNPALQNVVPNATSGEDTKLDPNKPELEWPTR